MLVGALAIMMLLTTLAPIVMASQGYWTPYSSDPSRGLKKYHIFLGGTYPSYVEKATKLVNENLTVCLDFSSTDAFPDTPKPLVCHPIKEREIPRTNDVGLFRSVR